MKTLTSLLIASALALAGAAMAQGPSPEESPGKKGGKGKAEQTTETKPTRNAGAEKKAGGNAAETKTKSNTAEANTPAPGGKERGAGKQGRRSTMGTTESSAPAATAAATAATTKETGAEKKGKRGKNAAAETGASASPGASQSPVEKGKKGKAAKGAAASASPAASASASASAAMSASPAVSASAATSPSVAAAGATGTSTMTKEQGTVGKGGKKVETQQVQQIKQQHASFKAQPKPDKAPPVTFNANYRISGVERWQGPQYEVFRSYHPEWHDQGWYRQRYGRVELIAGGYYYFNNGYWYPAWGYDPGAAYYAYDAPIYVGHRAEPPDRVIADVQAELQEMGYYTGEVDGLLGPLTRQALRDYQADHGLMVTEVIDEPTLDALQLS
jgi:Putative peptidoglycan binding domain